MVKNIDHMRSFLALLVMVKFYGEYIASVYSIILTGVTMNVVLYYSFSLGFVPLDICQ